MQEYKQDKVVEVGYLFRRDCWHNGYAAEAAIACKNYAFEKLGGIEVYSIIREGNTASINVAKRNGMKCKDKIIKHYKGINMSHFVYAVKKDA